MDLSGGKAEAAQHVVHHSQSMENVSAGSLGLPVSKQHHVGLNQTALKNVCIIYNGDCLCNQPLRACVVRRVIN